MNKFYSQSGEDFILNEIFKGQESGFFVEVGCIDGRRFSNTLHFEEKSWKGICVEAHAGYIEMLRKNRPNSIICHCAAAEKEEDAVFYANARGSLSTLDRSQENKLKREFGKYFTGFEEQQIRKRRLDSIFAECGVKEIDFMSLDIEGSEVEALRGIDFSKFKPTVLLVESDSPEHRKALENILRPAGYSEIGNIGVNVFYSIHKNLGSSIKGMYFKNVKLTHTQHPLDSGGDKEIIIDINMRSGASTSSSLMQCCMEMPSRIRSLLRKLLRL